MTPEAGSPSLNRHVPRTEDRARIEAALKVAVTAGLQAREHQSTSNILAVVMLATALGNIIDILSSGDPGSSQNETGCGKAKPPMKASNPQEEGRGK